MSKIIETALNWGLIAIALVHVGIMCYMLWTAWQVIGGLT